MACAWLTSIKQYWVFYSFLYESFPFFKLLWNAYNVKENLISFIVQNHQRSFLFEGNFYNFISLCTNALLACLYVMVIQRQCKLMGLQRNKNSSPQNNSKACFDMRDNTSSGDKAYLKISTKILIDLLM